MYSAKLDDYISVYESSHGAVQVESTRRADTNLRAELRDVITEYRRGLLLNGVVAPLREQCLNNAELKREDLWSRRRAEQLCASLLNPKSSAISSDKSGLAIPSDVPPMRVQEPRISPRTDVSSIDENQLSDGIDEHRFFEGIGDAATDSIGDAATPARHGAINLTDSDIRGPRAVPVPSPITSACAPIEDAQAVVNSGDQRAFDLSPIGVRGIPAAACSDSTPHLDVPEHCALTAKASSERSDIAGMHLTTEADTTVSKDLNTVVASSLPPGFTDMHVPEAISFILTDPRIRSSVESILSSQFGTHLPQHKDSDATMEQTLTNRTSHFPSTKQTSASSFDGNAVFTNGDDSTTPSLDGGVPFRAPTDVAKITMFAPTAPVHASTPATTSASRHSPIASTCVLGNAQAGPASTTPPAHASGHAAAEAHASVVASPFPVIVSEYCEPDDAPSLSPPVLGPSDPGARVRSPVRRAKMNTDANGQKYENPLHCATPLHCPSGDTESGKCRADRMRKPAADPQPFTAPAFARVPRPSVASRAQKRQERLEQTMNAFERDRHVLANRSTAELRSDVKERECQQNSMRERGDEDLESQSKTITDLVHDSRRVDSVNTYQRSARHVFERPRSANGELDAQSSVDDHFDFRSGNEHDHGGCVGCNARNECDHSMTDHSCESRCCCSRVLARSHECIRHRCEQEDGSFPRSAPQGYSRYQCINENDMCLTRSKKSNSILHDVPSMGASSAVIPPLEDSHTSVRRWSRCDERGGTTYGIGHRLHDHASHTSNWDATDNNIHTSAFSAGYSDDITIPLSPQGPQCTHPIHEEWPSRTHHDAPTPPHTRSIVDDRAFVFSSTPDAVPDADASCARTAPHHLGNNVPEKVTVSCGTLSHWQESPCAEIAAPQDVVPLRHGAHARTCIATDKDWDVVVTRSETVCRPEILEDTDIPQTELVVHSTELSECQPGARMNSLSLGSLSPRNTSSQHISRKVHSPTRRRGLPRSHNSGMAEKPRTTAVPLATVQEIPGPTAANASLPMWHDLPPQHAHMTSGRIKELEVPRSDGASVGAGRATERDGHRALLGVAPASARGMSPRQSNRLDSSPRKETEFLHNRAASAEHSLGCSTANECPNEALPITNSDRDVVFGDMQASAESGKRPRAVVVRNEHGEESVVVEINGVAIESIIRSLGHIKRLRDIGAS